MNESISLIAKTLLPFAKAISPKMRRLYKERIVGQRITEDISDLLEKGMDETLNRLTNGGGCDEWWKRLLDSIGHRYISPKFLKISAIGEWLSDYQVQADFKSLAKKNIMGRNNFDQDVFLRLRKTYADKTGENEKLSNGPIEVIVAIIVAGYLGSINDEVGSVAGMLQEHDRESQKNIKKIDLKLESINSKVDSLSSEHKRIDYPNINQIIQLSKEDSELISIH